MNIFLSWSGERSKQVAELLKVWLSNVIQASEPFLSTKDIDRGAIWFMDIANSLASINIGIICVTEENKNSPWILFESGALTKGLTSSRVCPFLIDLESTNIINNPLSQFNHTLPNEEILFELLKTVNKAITDKPLTDVILKNSFETFYPQFKKQFGEIIQRTQSTEPKIATTQADILEEILLTTRELEKRITYNEISLEKDRNIRESMRRAEMDNLFKLNSVLAKEANELRMALVKRPLPIFNSDEDKTD